MANQEEQHQNRKKLKALEYQELRELAKRIYIANAGDIKLQSIAKQVGVSDGLIRKWKMRDDWDAEPSFLPLVTKTEHVTVKEMRTKKANAQLDNPDEVLESLESPVQFEHVDRKVSNGSEWVRTDVVAGPHNNGFATTHALYAKNIPTDTIEILKQIDDQAFSPIEILWEQISILRALQIRSYKLMHVKDKEEIIRELKKVKYELVPIVNETGEQVLEQKETEAEYEFQFAWDRQATFADVMVRIATSLTQLIGQYEKMIRLGWGDEEQQLRIKMLRLQIKKDKSETQNKAVYIQADYGMGDGE